MAQETRKLRNGVTETRETATGTKKRRGFAAMTLEQRRAIASKGGVASHAKGTGHEWSRDEAILAGRKGGAKTADKRDKLPDVEG